MKDTENRSYAQSVRKVETVMQDTVVKSLHAINQLSTAVTHQRTALSSTLQSRAIPEGSFISDMNLHVAQLHELSQELVEQEQLDLSAAEKIVRLLDHLGEAATEHAQIAQQFTTQTYLAFSLPSLRDAAHTWRSYAR